MRLVKVDEGTGGLESEAVVSAARVHSLALAVSVSYGEGIP